MFIADVPNNGLPLCQNQLPKSKLVEVTHQCKWFYMYIAFCHFTRSSQPLSLPTWSNFFVTDPVTCQISKKWQVAGSCSLIHLVSDRCLSDINTAIPNPATFKKAKLSWAPFSPCHCCSSLGLPNTLKNTFYIQCTLLIEHLSSFKFLQ